MSFSNVVLYSVFSTNIDFNAVFTIFTDFSLHLCPKYLKNKISYCHEIVTIC